MRDNRSLASALRNLLRVHADTTMGRRAKAKAVAEAEQRVEACRPKSTLHRKPKAAR